MNLFSPLAMRTCLFRRSAAAAAFASLSLSLLSPLPAYAFSDVRGGAANSRAITALQARGVIRGYPDGTFRPGKTINRAEFLKIVLEGRLPTGSGQGGGKKEFSGSNCFGDVKNEWFAPYVCLAKKEKIVSGYPDGTFRPGQPITFVEAAKLLALSFRLDPVEEAGEWYEPYARALESSKAIPPSLSGLEHRVTRGEVAEMLWRLTDRRTGEPSKGYLNLKLPSLSVNFSSEGVLTGASCTDISLITQEFQRDVGVPEMALRVTAVGAPVMRSKAMSEDAGRDGDYSRTNVQVEGVDEADVVKTDGTFVYLLSNQKIRIVRASPASAMKEESTIDLSLEDAYPRDLYIDGPRLIVLATSTRKLPLPRPTSPEQRIVPPGFFPPFWYMQRTDVRIYDLSDVSHPRLQRTVSVDGNAISSRRIEDKLYLVTQRPLFWGGPVRIQAKNVPEPGLLPRVSDSTRAGATERAASPCGEVAILPHVPSLEYVTVAVVPLRSNAEVKTSVILGSADNIYASLQSLYVATTRWNYAWDSLHPQSSETTTVYRFALTGDGIALKADGSVPGRILNQFSMDESGDTFRIATTRGHAWDEKHPSTNNLYVLHVSDLERIGAVEDIAPGETIYSVRFLGKRAYMVTFQKIDPFFVIDLSSPSAPRILGKLKIPGYSDYLHPYDDDHIIGFGKEAVAAKEGNFAWYQGMKVAIFDVSDVANPRELHKITIGDRGTESPLLQNHKALLFDRERSLLAFPVTVAEIPSEQKKPGMEEAIYGTPVFQGAHVYRLTLKDGFSLLGTITHEDDKDVFTKAGDYWYNLGRDIQRILRIRDSLITVSPVSVRSHSFPGITLERKIDFAEEEKSGVYPEG